MELEFRRWGVFNLVAAGGFLIQLTTIALLTRKLGWAPLAATLAGLELAALHNFFGHNVWTFRDYPVRTARGWAGRYLRYQLAKTTSLGANALVTIGLVSVGTLPVEMANVVAVMVCALPNYLLVEKSFIQKKGRVQKDPAQVLADLKVGST